MWENWKVESQGNTFSPLLFRRGLEKVAPVLGDIANKSIEICIAAGYL